MEASPVEFSIEQVSWLVGQLESVAKALKEDRAPHAIKILGDVYLSGYERARFEIEKPLSKLPG